MGKFCPGLSGCSHSFSAVCIQADAAQFFTRNYWYQIHHLPPCSSQALRTRRRFRELACLLLCILPVLFCGGRGQVGKAKRMRSARPAGRAGAEKCHAQASGRVVHVFSVTACISTPEGVCWFKKEITCPGKLFCRMWP